MTAFKGLGTTGNGAGIVSPIDHKLAQAGQVAKATATAIRPGLFWPGTGTIITGTAGMSYSVAAYGCVTTRGATAGAVFGGNDGALSVATTAAPGSNSRIDIIYHWHREFSLDGVDSNPVIGVVQGTAAAVPVAPSLAAFPGAIEIGRATVAAGAVATNGAGVTITQTAPFTAMAGGVIAFRNSTERDAGTYLEGQLGWLVDSDTLQRYNGTSWLSMETAGLVRVVPTSVAGTGVTRDPVTGRVTASGSATININGVFDSSCDNYKIVAKFTSSSGASALNARMRAAGVDLSTGTYFSSSQVSSTTTPAYTVGGTATELIFGRVNGAGVGGAASFELFSPALAQQTNLLGSAVDSAFYLTAWGTVKNTIVYDGITLFTGGATLNGTVDIYKML